MGSTSRLMYILIYYMSTWSLRVRLRHYNLSAKPLYTKGITYAIHANTDRWDLDGTTMLFTAGAPDPLHSCSWTTWSLDPFQVHLVCLYTRNLRDTWRLRLRWHAWLWYTSKNHIVWMRLRILQGPFLRPQNSASHSKPKALKRNLAQSPLSIARASPKPLNSTSCRSWIVEFRDN